MTARELIALLSPFPPDTPVIIAKDREGNAYSPADNFTPADYLAETTWSGMIADEGETLPGAVPCVVIWPVS